MGVGYDVARRKQAQFMLKPCCHATRDVVPGRANELGFTPSSFYNDPSWQQPTWTASPEYRDSGLDAEPVIGPRLARTRWHRPGMTSTAAHRRHRHLVAAAGAAVDFVASTELQILAHADPHLAQPAAIAGDGDA